MAKKPNIISIDLSVWTTIQQKAAADKMKLTTLSTQIRRGQVEVWRIPELKLVLVKK